MEQEARGAPRNSPELLSGQHFVDFCGPVPYHPSMFSTFRRVAEALERLATTQSQLVRTQPSEQRLDDLEQLVAQLELERSRWEAEIEAVLMKAQGKLKAAAASESRERTMRKTYEHLIDPLHRDGDEVEAEAPVRGNHAAPGEGEGVPPVYMDVAPTGKAYALRAKYSL